MHRHHGYGPRCGRRGFGRGLSREEWLRRLEEYQRDLGQEIADVADLIRRLKEEKPVETATV